MSGPTRALYEHNSHTSPDRVVLDVVSPYGDLQLCDYDSDGAFTVARLMDLARSMIGTSGRSRR